MAHYVTCKFCKERFDRDKEPTVKISERRYAHKSCAEKQEALKTQDEKDLEAQWFEGKHLCGVTAGASTPDWIIEKIVGKISEIKV